MSELEITFDFLLTIPNILQKSAWQKLGYENMVSGLWLEKQALKYFRRFSDLKGETFWLVFGREYLPCVLCSDILTVLPHCLSVIAFPIDYDISVLYGSAWIKFVYLKGHNWVLISYRP